MKARFLTAAVVCALVFGVWARVTNLDRKVFFQDEAYGALRITGHTQAAYLRAFDGRVRSRDEILAFQRLDAHSSARTTLSSIASEEPQRGPLYYTLAALWVRIAGTSVEGFRSLSAAIGLLVIAAAYVFGRTLFEDARPAAMLAALVAVSPFHVRYAQQAREYGLFACVIFASSACLLFALRRGRAAWATYAIACAAGLATSPLFALIVTSHAAYVFYVLRGERGRVAADSPARMFVAYAAATAAGVAVMLPWFAYAVHSTGTVADQTEWATSPYPAAFALTKWLFNAGATFFDYEFADIRFSAVLVVLLPLVVWAVIRAFRGSRRATALALALGLPTLTAFLVKDVVSSAHFSTIPRYVTPLWIALEVLVTAGIYTALDAPSRRARCISSVAFAAMLASGLWCSVADSSARTWWDNNDNEPTIAVADVVNAASLPVLSTSNVAITLSLVHYLRAGVRVRLYARDAPAQATVRDLPGSGGTVFLFLPSHAERAAFVRRGVVLTNVSPAGDTIVHRFHSALQRERPGTHSRSLAELSGANALWQAGSQVRHRASR